jgi:hypothetical protein
MHRLSSTTRGNQPVEGSIGRTYPSAQPNADVVGESILPGGTERHDVCDQNGSGRD